MSKSSFTISIGQEKFSKFKTQLVQAGTITDTQLQGSLPVTKGVSLSFAVQGDPNAENVSVLFTVDNKPFFISVSEIQNAIASKINN
jgi:hypothetical protein